MGLVTGLLAAFWLVGSAMAAQTAERRFVTEQFPPYTYAENGRAAGPMVDLLEAVCAELRWRCRVEVLPWRRALAEAQRGEADGIFTVVDTPERRSYFHVSVPVIEARYTLFGRAGDDFHYPELIEGDAGFVVPYLDLEAMADRVVELGRSAELRERLGRRGAAKVRERCDVEVIGRKLHSVIERFL